MLKIYTFLNFFSYSLGNLVTGGAVRNSCPRLESYRVTLFSQCSQCINLILSVDKELHTMPYLVSVWVILSLQQTVSGLTVLLVCILAVIILSCKTESMLFKR